MIKKILYSLENIVGKNMGYRKVLVTDTEGNAYIRQVSHNKIQNLILDSSIKSVKFLD